MPALRLRSPCWRRSRRRRASPPMPWRTTSSVSAAFIGSGDRREVSDQVWHVLRHQRRLDWWTLRAQGQPSPRLAVGAAAVLGGPPVLRRGENVQRRPLCPRTPDGGRGGDPPPPERSHLRSSGMPDAVRLEVPDWIMPLLVERFGRDTDREVSAMLAPAPLDLRVNLLKGDRAGGPGGARGRGDRGRGDRAEPLGAAHRRPQACRDGRGLPLRSRRDSG